MMRTTTHAPSIDQVETCNRILSREAHPLVSGEVVLGHQATFDPGTGDYSLALHVVQERDDEQWSDASYITRCFRIDPVGKVVRASTSTPEEEHEIEATNRTLGVTAGNPDLNMPPFAVDIIDGQGNGDVTDAVIALRGRILNDTSLQPVSSVTFVACNWEEAETVAVALEQWSEALAEDVDEATDDDVEDVRYLAKRYRMIERGEH